MACGVRSIYMRMSRKQRQVDRGVLNSCEIVEV